jgi:Arc/MetJ-type ribon-helix-helix transcriptional regulator
MTVDLKPEQERIIQEQLASGHFQDVDDLLTQALDALREKSQNQKSIAPADKPRKNFAQFLLESPLPGSGLKLERQRDYPRPVNL